MAGTRKLVVAVVGVGLLLGLTAPSAQADAYNHYVACGTSGRADPAHVCSPRRAASGNVGAFFRSNVGDVVYKVCVKFPGANAPRCVGDQDALRGRLYVNPITSKQTGRHKVTWFVGGKRVGLYFFRVGTSSPTIRRCRRVRDVVPGGVRPTPAINIRAVGVGCRKARSLPARFIRKVRYGRRAYERVGIWRCRGADTWPYRTVCTAAGGKRVSWRLGRG